MAGTRSSARQAARTRTDPPSQSRPAPRAGSSKRKASGYGPKPKRGKKGDEKEQTTIEASMSNGDDDGERKNAESDDVDMKDVHSEEPKSEEKDPGDVAKEPASFEMRKVESNEHGKVDDHKPQENGFDKLMKNSQSDSKEPMVVTEEGTGSKVSASENAVDENSKREEQVPSSILEKGVIYFFFRGRVGIDEPSGVDEIARSYIVLRPLPQGAKLGEGPIGDAGNNRMLSLPKKVLPVSPKDRFMTFVEKSNSSLDDIKNQLSSSDYATKTAGLRHSPAAAPIGEGVYAITQTGRETHLAYILTIPSELSDVQKGVGRSF